MANWLLQSNPQRWRLAEFLDEHPPAELSAWSVNRYLDQVSQGDNLALWQSGPNAGVVALGHATAQLMKPSVPLMPTGKTWNRPSEPAGGCRCD